MVTYPLLEVRVWGEWACFTRPEMKAERVSYPIITPSAARGMLEALFWKPEFQWRIHEIHLLNPIRTFSILRNEVNKKASIDRARSGYFADEDRAQRHTLGLRKVAYLIRAEVAVSPTVSEDAAKYRDQFRRRVERGQCYTSPYLGCREFPACFGPPIPEEQPYPHTEDLGLMLFDLRYDKQKGIATPVFFKASLAHGILQVPQDLYAQLEVPHGAG